MVLPDRVTEERIAKNDSLFREANERVESVAAEQGLTTHPVPFICECADLQCTRTTLLTLEEYWHVRSNPRWFVNAPGHDSAALGAVTVVENHESYVEKLGHAGEVAEQLANREAGVEGQARGRSCLRRGGPARCAPRLVAGLAVLVVLCES